MNCNKPCSGMTDRTTGDTSGWVSTVHNSLERLKLGDEGRGTASSPQAATRLFTWTTSGKVTFRSKLSGMVSESAHMELCKEMGTRVVDGGNAAAVSTLVRNRDTFANRAAPTVVSENRVIRRGREVAAVALPKVTRQRRSPQDPDRETENKVPPTYNNGH